MQHNKANASTSCLINSPPPAKRRRNDEKSRESTRNTQGAGTFEDMNSTHLVVNTFLKHIATSEKLLLTNMIMTGIESSLRDVRGFHDGICSNSNNQASDFVDAILDLNGCAIILHALRKWVDTDTNDGTMEEDTASFVSITLGTFLHMMAYNRRATSCLLDVKGAHHITRILIHICQKASLHINILCQAIVLWGNLMMNVTRREDALVEDISSLILKIMAKHPRCEIIQRNGCKFFSALASMPLTSRESQDFDPECLRQVIQQALVQYQRNKRTLYWAHQGSILYSAGHLVPETIDDDLFVTNDWHDSSVDSLNFQ